MVDSERCSLKSISILYLFSELQSGSEDSGVSLLQVPHLAYEIETG